MTLQGEGKLLDAAEKWKALLEQSQGQQARMSFRTPWYAMVVSGGARMGRREIRLLGAYRLVHRRHRDSVQ
ncbi:MAG: hypothetical protein A3K19_03605 [Lentisphaerae bacterium RIFOXYB12_FULL_65_16]|nr:MAG: hypothetical protein A3K18_30105 [Lentisphaerae bacterium RIFOXYA12_64_32]OGV86600.1 MAG: hypothetical protein A3K19_03605 [Lentisphaerae bacterium RIFOXYB12_FULL_65_16]